MKGTVLFCLLFLSLSASYGQKSPCDLKKSTWQTALSVEDGTVQYLVETSNCVGSEVCGQPRIILKHTFKKPLWFKVKLRGFDCSNSQLETTFATGNKHIAPDEEFSVQQNWHSFKAVTEVLNVEVTYEQPVVKHITFNKEDNTIKNYTNGTLVDQAVVAAASTPSVETTKTAEKSIVAVVSTPVAKPTKTIEKPVVSKTTKTIEKPVAAVSIPSVEKVETVEKPVAAATSTPSVETAKTVDEPVVSSRKDPSVQTEKTVEKVVEKPTEKPVVVQPVEKLRGSESPKNNTDEPKAASIATTPEVSTEAIKTVRKRLNVLKTDIFSPLSIGYERGLGKHLSLVINGLYFPSVSYGTPEGTTGYLSLTKPSVGFLGEARLYTSKKKAPLNGFYVGGYYQFRTLDMQSRKISTTATTETDIQITIPSSFANLGLMIGGQRIRSRGFTTDLSIGVGIYSFSGIPVISNDSNAFLKNLSWLSKMQSGIALRLGLSLGYAF
jgi:hypothetical protein